jgi:hypothetical protein
MKLFRNIKAWWIKWKRAGQQPMTEADWQSLDAIMGTGEFKR